MWCVCFILEPADLYFSPCGFAMDLLEQSIESTMLCHVCHTCITWRTVEKEKEMPRKSHVRCRMEPLQSSWLLSLYLKAMSVKSSCQHFSPSFCNVEEKKRVLAFFCQYNFCKMVEAFGKSNYFVVF